VHAPRSVATRTALHVVLFGARPDCDQPEIKLIDVQMLPRGYLRDQVEKKAIQIEAAHEVTELLRSPG
jgi:hypothetical protein